MSYTNPFTNTIEAVRQRPADRFCFSPLAECLWPASVCAAPAAPPDMDQALGRRSELPAKTSTSSAGLG